MMFFEYVKDKIIDLIVEIYRIRKYILTIIISLIIVFINYHYYGTVVGDTSIWVCIISIFLYYAIKFDYDIWKRRKGKQ